MQVIRVKKLEDCFDGSSIFEYSFDKEINEDFMKSLSIKGKLFYYPDFPKPFFKIVTFDSLQLKGIIGEGSLQVLFPRENKFQRKLEFEERLKG